MIDQTQVSRHANRVFVRFQEVIAPFNGGMKKIKQRIAANDGKGFHRQLIKSIMPHILAQGTKSSAGMAAITGPHLPREGRARETERDSLKRELERRQKINMNTANRQQWPAALLHKRTE